MLSHHVGQVRDLAVSHGNAGLGERRTVRVLVVALAVRGSS